MKLPDAYFDHAVRITLFHSKLNSPANFNGACKVIPLDAISSLSSYRLVDLLKISRMRDGQGLRGCDLALRAPIKAQYLINTIDSSSRQREYSSGPGEAF
jgi:hypothetical protein